MPEEQSSSPGLFASVRRLVCTFLAILQNRLEIATVEAHQETRRLVAMLIFVGVAVAFLFLGMFSVTAMLAVAFWPQAFWVLVGFSVFYLGVAGGALLYVRKRLKEPLFPETIAQLKKDRQWLLPGK